MALSRVGLGNLSNAKSIDGALFEYRINFGPGYRIYFGRDGNDIVVLLGGGTKKRQQQDIATAQARWADYKATQAGAMMALTRNFKETVKARVERDPKFRAALLQEAVEQMLSGDMETGKAVMRDYINATVGFERLARETGRPAKSLMRMFGPNGNPRASNLFAVISRLQKASKVRLEIAASP
jgi:putative addiction module killer protein